jgi:hypothetical protein
VLSSQSGGIATIGISEHAQSALGDIVFVEVSRDFHGMWTCVYAWTCKASTPHVCVEHAPHHANEKRNMILISDFSPQLPEVGDKVEAGKTLAAVESVKAAADVSIRCFHANKQKRTGMLGCSRHACSRAFCTTSNFARMD